MLDEKKVRLMARTALYEQSFGSRIIKLNSSYKKGAESAALLYHVPSGIITYILVAGCVAAAVYDPVRELYDKLGFVISLVLFAVCGIVFVFLYALYARYMMKKKYEEDKGVFWKYHFTKEKLKKMNNPGRSATKAEGGGRK